jgi:hypothetical protein
VFGAVRRRDGRETVRVDTVNEDAVVRSAMDGHWTPGAAPSSAVDAAAA